VCEPMKPFAPVTKTLCAIRYLEVLAD
jgi:hypothetical protein